MRLPTCFMDEWCDLYDVGFRKCSEVKECPCGYDDDDDDEIDYEEGWNDR